MPTRQRRSGWQKRRSHTGEAGADRRDGAAALDGRTGVSGTTAAVYLTTPTPTWPAIVDAADWLRGELGVSKSLWGAACVAMGREEAAIAVAILSAKPAGHFRSSPGGYFHGMVAKAKAGELNLARDDLGAARE